MLIMLEKYVMIVLTQSGAFSMGAAAPG